LLKTSPPKFSVLSAARHLVNPAALIPVTQPGDLRQDRVGQLVKRVLDGMTSDETRRAYSHALEMFLEFCDREGNPTLSAELVASYRVSLVGEGKSSSTVGVHLAAIKALTRAAVRGQSHALVPRRLTTKNRSHW
jgi:hypothetical protein